MLNRDPIRFGWVDRHHSEVLSEPGLRRYSFTEQCFKGHSGVFNWSGVDVWSHGRYSQIPLHKTMMCFYSQIKETWRHGGVVADTVASNLQIRFLSQVCVCGVSMYLVGFLRVWFPPRSEDMQIRLISLPKYPVVRMSLFVPRDGLVLRSGCILLHEHPKSPGIGSRRLTYT